MSFWCRINKSKLIHLNHQLKRCYLQTPSLNHATTTQPRTYLVENPLSSFVKRPTQFCNNVRFFAAPVQYQKKKEVDESGPRLNDEISAQFIRLVTEEGHTVVSRHEALQLAMELKLDLVEVQRNAKPPVCKIMDFHREQYKKEQQEKDRAKAKSEGALKTGSCKEVRFSGKIEHKDLKMKADTVKRMIENGYRVKCMATPVGKKGEQEDLGGYLSRLLALIEDISVIESGPHVERSKAYVIIRHLKFGPSKKSGKNAKAFADMSSVSRKASTSSPTINPSGDVSGPAVREEDPAEFGLENEDQTLDKVHQPISRPMQMQATSNQKKTAWSVSESGDDFNKVFDLRDAPKDKHPLTSPETSEGAGNRYKRSEPMNQFPPTRPMNQFPPTRPMDTRGPRMSDSVRPGPPQYPNQRRQPPPNASGFRSTNPSNNMPKQEQSRSSFGIFSTPNTNASGRQDARANTHRNGEGRPNAPARNPGSAGVGANRNIPGSQSDGSNQRPGTDNGQKQWGIFSK